MPKHALVEVPDILTAGGFYSCPDAAYHFFDAQTGEVRQSIGLRRDGDYLSTFGLKVVAVAKLRINRDDANQEA